MIKKFHHSPTNIFAWAHWSKHITKQNILRLNWGISKDIPQVIFPNFQTLHPIWKTLCSRFMCYVVVIKEGTCFFPLPNHFREH